MVGDDDLLKVMALQPLVSPVNGSRGFKWLKEKYSDFILEDPSNSRHERKYLAVISDSGFCGF